MVFRRVALAAAAAIAASCMNPVEDDRIASLGGEAAGERPGPLHRAGQPCTFCHSDTGPGEPSFMIAGTVYATSDGTAPASGVQVVLTAADGSTRTLVSNAAGNFYLRTDQWDAPYPMHVELVDGTYEKKMLTRIGGEGGCAFCHRGTASASQMARVYLRDP